MKIFNLRSADLGAENNVPEIFDDFQVAEPFEHDHVEQTIIDHGMLEKRERPSVKATVADKNKRSFAHRSIFRFDE